MTLQRWSALLYFAVSAAQARALAEPLSFAIPALWGLGFRYPARRIAGDPAAAENFIGSQNDRDALALWSGSLQAPGQKRRGAIIVTYSASTDFEGTCGILDSLFALCRFLLRDGPTGRSCN